MTIVLSVHGCRNGAFVLYLSSCSNSSRYGAAEVTCLRSGIVAPSSELVGSPVSLLMVLEDRSIFDKRIREKVLTWYACAQVVVTFHPQEFMNVAFKMKL